MWWLPGRTSAACFVLSVCIFQNIIPVTAQVVINELYYDHPGADSGWEFIELYKSGAGSLDLTGVKLEFIDGRTGASRVVWNAPDGLVIGPGEMLLVAGERRGPAEDMILQGTLENGPDAVRLVRDGEYLDLIGYGAVPSPDMYEGEPAVDVEAGFSLSRRPDGFDSGHNGNDLVESGPTPGMRNFHELDIGISILDERILPCRGELFSLTFILRNEGLEPFGGYVHVTFMERLGLQLVPVDSSVVSCDMETGASSMVRQSFGPFPGYRSEVAAVLWSPHDGCSFNDTTSVLIHSSPGRVIINEVMYRPLNGEGEWIELYNGGIDPVDIGAWSIADAAFSPKVIGGDGFRFEPGSYLIIAQYPDGFTQRWPHCGESVLGVSGGWCRLNDSGDDVAETIHLFDGDGALAERVEYGNLVDEERGRSIERIAVTVCSALPGGIWHRCADPAGATPCAGNTACVPSLPGEKTVTVNPNPFCPERDGFVRITASMRDGESGAVVRVFDLEGFEIRTLFAESGGARVFSCCWDGRCRDGKVTSTGLYVCLVEFVKRGGGVCRRKKRCIAVSGVDRGPW